jgi:hypothetical protein
MLGRAVTAEHDVVAVHVEVVPDLPRQRRLLHGPGAVGAGRKVLAHLENIWSYETALQDGDQFADMCNFFKKVRKKIDNLDFL